MDNQVIDILKTVIQQYGDCILADAKLCRALLQDHCRGAYAREVKLILLALEEGVATDLRHQPAGLPSSLLGSRLVEHLVAERYLDRTAAEWIVCAWADALSISLPTVASVLIPPMAKPISPGVATPAPEQRYIPYSSSNTLNGQIAQLGIELITIPAGEFLSGENMERKYLPAFTIMKYPVTVAQYRQFCEATTQAMPADPPWDWHDDHPMVNVTWHDAMAFAAWAGLDMPTEENWEKSARGTDGREYPWGNIWDATKCCNSVVKSSGGTSTVGSYPAGASPYGVHDLVGNVWEWCDSWYDDSKKARVLRGGGWGNGLTRRSRAAYRSSDAPTYRSDLNGFRCASRSSGP